MRFLYTSDLHGNVKKYSQVLDLIRSVKPDAFVYGGDFFEFNRYTVKSKLDYAIDFLREFFTAVAVPSFLIPGNVDFPMTVQGMRKLEREGLFTFLTYTPTRFSNNLSLYGYPFVTPTPFRRKDYERRDLISDDVHISEGSFISHVDGTITQVSQSYLNTIPSIEEDLQAFAGSARRSIYVIHVPPAQTGLDVIHDGRNVGSIAVRRHILKHQPIISLHGHIHESPSMSGRWVEKLGETICVNPGQQSSELHAVIFELNDTQVESLSHTVYGQSDLLL
jgi:uncharacterized protein